MKTGAVILARMTSTRLPGKGLRCINGQEILSYIVDSLKMASSLDNIIIATSCESEDDPLEVFSKYKGVKIYRGALHDVADRFMQAAIVNGLDYAVRINGDNLFINSSLVEKSLNIALKNNREFVSNVPGRTYPKGMSVEVIKISFYKSIYRNFEHESNFEHVTEYLYQNIKNIDFQFFENDELPAFSGIDLAIDNQYDFERASKIIAKLSKPLKNVDFNQLFKAYVNSESEMNFKGQHGPLLIAEIGGNHEGNFEYAKRLTLLAIESDSDFVKFQMYSGKTLVNPVVSPDRFEHFKKFELSREQYVELAGLVVASGKRFMASIWDVDMIEWVDEYNPVYKVGSGDLLAFPLLKNLAARSKPIILSTGLATEAEVLEAVLFIRSCNQLYEDPNYLAVLQCTSMYPIPASAANLSVMNTLKKTTGATIGYSDHTEGSAALNAAVVLGAEILEFHFTDTRENQKFRDHKVSLTCKEVLKLIEDIKLFNILKGDPEKKPVQIEVEHNHVESFRRAVYLTRDMSRGEVVTESDITILRPCIGLSSKFYFNLIGMELKRNIDKYEILSLDDFQ